MDGEEADACTAEDVRASIGNVDGEDAEGDARSDDGGTEREDDPAFGKLNDRGSSTGEERVASGRGNWRNSLAFRSDVLGGGVGAESELLTDEAGDVARNMAGNVAGNETATE